MSEAEFTLPSAAAAESPAMEVSGYTITPTSLAVLIAILLGFVLCLGFALWHARNVCADHGVYCLDRYCFCCCRRGEGKGNDGGIQHGEGLEYPAPTMTFSGGEEGEEEGSSAPTGSNSAGGGGSSNGSGRSGKRRSPNGTEQTQPRGVAGDNSSVLTPEPTETRATSCGRKPTTASRYSHTPGTAHIMRNYDFRNDVSTVMGVGGTDGVGGGEGGGGVGDWSVMAHSYLKSPDSPSTYGGSEDGRGGGNDKSSKSRGDGATTGGSGNVGNRDDANDVSSLGDGSAYESCCEEGGGGKDGGFAELAKIQEEEVWRDEQTRKVAGAGDGVTEVVPAASRRDDGKDGGTGANGGDVEKNAAGHDDDDHDDDDNFDYADNNTSKSSVFGRLDFSALWGGGNGGGGADQPDIEEGEEHRQDGTDRNKGGGNSSMLDFSSLWKAGEEQQQEQGQAGRARARARAAKVGSGRGIEALGTVEEAGDSNMLDISQDSESHVRVL